ncbi:MAG TPA: flagellar motor protein MotB [Edaphobacter sp.]|jgi:chemotaxis protein MotB
MSRKKKHEHVNHERWLVSYADFITLLFAFFVVLFASSQSDRKKQMEVAAAMQTAFTPLGSFEAHAKTPPIEQAPSASTVTRPAALALPFPQAGQTTREEEVRARLNRLLNQAEEKLPKGSVTTRMTPEGLVISLHEIGFFASGAAEVRRESIPMLAALAETIPDAPLRVEGHTDNVPIHTTQFSSNWELSTARASAITRLLLERGAIHPENISAAGYAEYHPVASNATETGRSMNRRVDIILLRAPAASR